MEIFANMVAKCSPKYLVETINMPKNWYELTLKAKNMFKDIFVWLKLNNFNNEIKNFQNNQNDHQPNLVADNDDNLPKTTNESSQNKSNNDSSKKLSHNNSNDSLYQQQQIQRSRTKKRLNKKQYEEGNYPLFLKQIKFRNNNKII